MHLTTSARTRKSFLALIGGAAGALTFGLRAARAAASYGSKILTPSSPTAITSLVVAVPGVTGLLLEVSSTNASAQPVTLTIFDEGASPTGAAADAIFGPAAIGPGQTVAKNLPFKNGLAYALSGAAAPNIVIAWALEA